MTSTKQSKPGALALAEALADLIANGEDSRIKAHAALAAHRAATAGERGK